MTRGFAKKLDEAGSQATERSFGSRCIVAAVSGQGAVSPPASSDRYRLSASMLYQQHQVADFFQKLGCSSMNGEAPGAIFREH